MDGDGKAVVAVVTVFLFLVIIVGVAGMVGCPHYNVWQQGLEGQAELARAEQNRKIAVQEAQAKEESAKHLAQAEIERAKGVAEANRIIGESISGEHGKAYLHWLYIHEALGPNNTNMKTIYIPTEAGLPILEAGAAIK